MKALPVVLAAMMALTNVWAVKKVDLSAFDGNYTGNGSLTIQEFSNPLTAEVKFDVARNGRRSKVTISGIIAEGATPWETTLRLKKKRKMKTNNVSGIDFGPGIFPAAGKYKVRRKSKLESTAVTRGTTPVMEQKVSMDVKPKGRRKELTGTIAVFFDGVEFAAYRFTATGK